MIIDQPDHRAGTAVPWPAARLTPVRELPPRPGVRPRSPRLPAALVTADAGAMALAAGAAPWAFDVNPVAGLAAVPLVVVLNASAHLYQRRLALSALDDAVSLAARGIVALLITLAMCAALRTPGALVGIAAALGLAAAGYIAAVTAARTACYAAVRHARRAGPRPMVILGGGAIAERIAGRLMLRPEYGLRPVGYVDSRPSDGLDGRRIPNLGDIGDLAEVIIGQRAYDVIIAFGSFRDHDVLAAVETCRRLGCDVFCVPRFFELQGLRGSRWVENVWGMPLIRLPRRPHVSPLWRVKRLIDIVGAAAGLLVTAPLLAACALAVRVEGGPGVLFRQNRVGLDGRPFTVLKFRTLRPADDAESATRWSIAADDRLGPAGRFLRRTSLDELPQLWNILRGDMSLVGPRPERPHFVAEFTRTFPRYDARHRVPAGLTGLAQVNGLRGDTSIEERARFDNLYIESWSLWQDIKIILRTLLAPLRRTGA